VTGSESVQPGACAKDRSKRLEVAPTCPSVDGLTSDYIPFPSRVTVKSILSSSRKKQRGFGAMTGGLEHVEPELGAPRSVALTDHSIRHDLGILVALVRSERT